MQKRAGSLRIIVDASVLRASGVSDNECASCCRAALECILTVCHRVGVNSEILKEWREHQSRFAIAWLASMFARRKVLRQESLVDPEVSRRLQRLQHESGASPEVLKDLPLISGAMAFDHLILSLDERARDFVVIASSTLGPLKDLRCFNPMRDRSTVDWIREGAPPKSRNCPTVRPSRLAI